MNVEKNNRCVYVIGTEVPPPGGIQEYEKITYY